MKTLFEENYCRIGFTGTRRGMSELQLQRCKKFLTRFKKRFDNVEVHHGDCFGADSDFHDLCVNVFRDAPERLRIVVHPPSNPTFRAYKTFENQIVQPSFDYLVRNKNIVDSVEYMIATPLEEFEKLRSGTWSTVRYARRNKKKLKVVYP